MKVVKVPSHESSNGCDMMSNVTVRLSMRLLALMLCRMAFAPGALTDYDGFIDIITISRSCLSSEFWILKVL